MFRPTRLTDEIFHNFITTRMRMCTSFTSTDGDVGEYVFAASCASAGFVGDSAEKSTTEKLLWCILILVRIRGDGNVHVSMMNVMRIA